MTSKAKGYATHAATDQLAPFDFERRDVGPKDVDLEILYAGICHSDIHQARNEWGGSIYPMVPGHEIVGRVVKTGSDVSNFKEGDIVGVGCLVDSCRHCDSCNHGLEQYCENGFVGTYNGIGKDGQPTYGGYSDHIVVDERFVLSVPKNLDLKAVAPLLCAGITTYSPLRHWKVKSGDKVGIVGLGGLGHMGVKFADAMGAHVVMITTSPEKGEDAKKLGADEVLLSKDAASMDKHANSFDFILNTIPVGHDVNPYINLLKRDGVMCIVGALDALPAVNGAGMILKRKTVAGSLIGGLPETQEMLNFCGENNIVCDVEMIGVEDINAAYDRTVKGDVKYRFVIDMASLKAAA
ncbi:MAG: hydroxyacid dehydrogenase [Micavibrio aeruginosavorus]|uniref:Hydroxyacid dehydrogenase n=1 Tax=Micavibrio aeruginosavorus TaxID=349221 RepID=A0A2W5FMZ5_9BACT|nr:MAG: hydroxyacid dehydrogenase [Micavibrio aeruginosavorus]